MNMFHSISTSSRGKGVWGLTIFVFVVLTGTAFVMVPSSVSAQSAAPSVPAPASGIPKPLPADHLYNVLNRETSSRPAADASAFTGTVKIGGAVLDATRSALQIATLKIGAPQNTGGLITIAPDIGGNDWGGYINLQRKSDNLFWHISGPRGGSDNGDLTFFYNNGNYHPVLTLQNDGKVGIGTTGPGSLLTTDVNTGDVATGLQLANSATNDTIGRGSQILFTGTDTENIASIVGSTNAPSNRTGALSFRTSNDGILHDVMFLDQNGNVGIGTDTPREKLHIYDATDPSIRVQGPEGVNGSVQVQNGGHVFSMVGGNGVRFNQVQNGDDDQTRMAITGDGRVGIGMTDPKSPFHVSSSSSDMMRVENVGGAEADIRFLASTGGWQVGTNNAGNGTQGNQFYIYNDNDESYPLTVQRGTGNVGIGTRGPAQKLHVVGMSRLGDDATQPVFFGNYGSLLSSDTHINHNMYYDGSWKVRSVSVPSSSIRLGTTSDANIVFLNTAENGGQGTEKMRITTDGNVGIGTNDPQAKLDIAGSFRQAGLTRHPVGNLYAASAPTNVRYTYDYNNRNHYHDNPQKARAFEIARIGYDRNDWSSNTTVFIELYNRHFASGGYKRYAVSAGFIDNGTIRLLEATGQYSNSNNQDVRVRFEGDPVSVGEASNQQFYRRVFVDVDYYSSWNIVVSHGMQETKSTVPGVAQIWIAENPQGAQIASFDEKDVVTHDSDLRVNGKLQVYNETNSAGDFAGYTGKSADGNTDYFWPKGYRPEILVSQPRRESATQSLTYRGGIGLGEGVGIYSLNPNPQGSPYYGDIRFHTTVWNDKTGKYENYDRMVISHGGNVGIGTTSPRGTLDVNGRNAYIGSIAVAIGYAGNDYPGIGYNFEAQAGNDNIWKYKATDTAYMIGLGQGHRLDFNYAPSGSAGDTISWTTGMTMKNNGNVGIGITPNSVGYLQLPGVFDNRFASLGINEGRLLIGSDKRSGNGAIFAQGGDALLAVGAQGAIQFMTGSVAPANERMRINSDGSVVIGKWPDKPAEGILDVYGGSTYLINRYETYDIDKPWESGILRLVNRDNANGNLISLNFEGRDVKNNQLTAGAIALQYTSHGENDMDTKMHFGTTNNSIYGTRMTIDNVGNVGIGTTSPEVAGGGFNGMDIRGTSGSSVVLGKYGSGRAVAFLYSDSAYLNFETPDYIAFRPGKTEKMRITASGNVGIGTIDPKANLEVRSTVLVNGPQQNSYSASAYEWKTTDSNALWHLGFRGDQSQEKGNLTFWYSPDPARGNNWRSPISLDQSGSVGMGYTWVRGWRLAVNGPTAITGNLAVKTTEWPPQSAIEVGNNGWITLRPLQYTAGLNFYESGTRTYGGEKVQYGARIFYNGNEDKLVIQTMNDDVEKSGITIARATGNVGIGKDPSDKKLDVFGDIKVTSGGSHIASREKDRIGFDVAELFTAEESVDVGDVLVVGKTDSTVRKSRRQHEDALIGVVSGSPAILFEGDNLLIGSKPYRFQKGTKPPVALAGRVPVKVSTENGFIRTGDYLTSSSMSGVAMKAEKGAPIIGIALESYKGYGVGTALMFININQNNTIDSYHVLESRVKKLEKELSSIKQKQ